MKRKVILYIAQSLDGYIAAPNDDLSFLSLVEKAGEDYGYTDFINSVDTVIMGRKTYDWVMSQVKVFPHLDKEAYVITHEPRKSIYNVNFYSGDLEVLMMSLKEQTGKNIFIDGGATLINELLKLKLIDELCISIVPILLGSGTKLFHEGIPSQQLKCIQTKRYDTGLVQIHYEIMKK